MEQPITIENVFIKRLCLSYEAQLVDYLAQVLGDRERSRELAQESFVALQNVSRPEWLAFPRAALFKVATYLAVMELHRRRKEKRIPVKIPEVANHMEQVPDTCMGPDPQVMTSQLGDQVAAVIKELRPNLRNVFVMAHVECKPRAEIAAALGISEECVDKRMTKALKACRERLLRGKVRKWLFHFCAGK